MKTSKAIFSFCFAWAGCSFFGSVAPIYALAPNALDVKVGDIALVRAHHPADGLQLNPVAIDQDSLRTYELWDEATNQNDLAAETKAPAEELVKQGKISLLPNNTKVRVLEIAPAGRFRCRVEVLSGDHKGFQGWTDDVETPDMGVPDLVYLIKASELAYSDKDYVDYHRAISNGDEKLRDRILRSKRLFLVQAETKCQIEAQQPTNSKANLYRVTVLEGPMKGTVGWTAPDALSLEAPSAASSPFLAPLGSREAQADGDYANVNLPSSLDLSSLTSTEIIIDFLVDEQGLPTEITVAKSSGNSQLDRALEKSIENTRFLAGIKDHHFVASRCSRTFDLGH